MANASKSYFAMQRGLNTEAPLINFPDGFTTDEQNYEITIKGERRRRLGLALETGGVNLALDNTGYTAGYPIRVFDWENVANVPSTNFMVVQLGYTLWIFDDRNPMSTTKKSAIIDIRPYAVPEATAAQVGASPLESAFGRGHLFLFGAYTNPFYIEYNPDTELFVLNQIDIEERDFDGVDDGYSNTDQPTAATESHTYNLRNRGWTQAYIDAFQADQSKQPSKAMIPWLGLKRALTAGNYYDDDGIRTFSAPKLVAELFQDATAPMGHMIKSPFSTNSNPDSNSSNAISGWTISGTSSGPQTMTIVTTSNHGLIPAQEITISNLRAYYNTDDDIPLIPSFEVNGAYTVVATPTLTTFTITVNFAPIWPWVSWRDQFNRLGSVIGGAVPNPTGNVTELRPKAGAFFAGRVWFAGIDTARLGGRIYFSQVIESDNQYSKCYQVADPTDERLSELAPADGGVIVIPEAANVLKLLPYESSLLVYASNGVWEIGPGDRGYFAADNYSVRKLTDNGAASAGSVAITDSVPYHFGITDIYLIEPDQYTGRLKAVNISEGVINTFYNNIPLDSRHRVECVYDDLNKRVIWLYNSSASNTNYTYNKGLVYDTRLKAFTPMEYAYSNTNYLAGICLLKEAAQVSKVKYLGIVNNQLVIGEARNYDDYTDFGIGEASCYLVTGIDSLRSPADFKLAPMVWVFSRKTETGYTSTLDAVRPSSTRLRARWEWADSASAGKWGREQEVYRHARVYVPTDSSDTFNDGTPVVVTKNKLRGKGRVLQLEFTAGAGKDSYLMGWKTNFTQLGS